MSRSSAVLSLCLLCTLAGCSGPGASRREEGRRADDPVLGLVRAAGHDAVVTVLLRPARWPASQRARESLAALGERVGGKDGEALRGVASAPSAWAALVGLSTFAGGSPLPASLPGWDQGRPLVLGLFAAPPADLALLAEALLPGAAAPRPLIRHRLVVPAKDPGALRAALIEIAGRLGLRPDPEGASRLGLRDGVYRDGRTGVALRPAADHVRIDVVPCRAASCATPWQEADTPAPAAQPMTPALRFALADGPLASAYVRPWRLRDHALAHGTQNILDALEVADPAMRLVLGMQGWSEVAAGQLLLSGTAQESEQEDVAVTLSTGPGVRVAALSSLTPLGAALLSGAARSAARPLQIQDTEAPPLLRGGFALDLAALIQKAPRLTAPKGVPEERRGRRPWALLTMIQECGAACVIDLELRRPLAMLATFVLQDVRPYLPAALSAVFTEVRRGDPPVTFALAASFPAGWDLGMAQSLMQAMGRERGLRTEVRPAGAGQALLLGAGDEPGRRLGPGFMTLPAGVLAEVSIAPAQMLDVSMGRKDRALLELVRGLRGRLTLTEEALHAEVLLDLSGPGPDEGSAVFAGAPARLGEGWTSLSPRATEGARCLEQAVVGLRQAFKAVASAAPEQRAKLLSAAFDENRAPLDCAARDPGTQKTAARLQSALPALMKQLSAP